MKKIYTIEELGCASCASKMEKEINMLEGVNNATITFMTRKFVLDAEDDKFDEVLEKSRKIIRKIEPDTELRPFRR